MATLKADGIKIYLRVRPTKNPSGFWELNKAKSTLNFDIPKEAVDGLVNNSPPRTTLSSTTSSTWTRRSRMSLRCWQSP